MHDPEQFHIDEGASKDRVHYLKFDVDDADWSTIRRLRPPDDGWNDTQVMLLKLLQVSPEGVSIEEIKALLNPRSGDEETRVLVKQPKRPGVYIQTMNQRMRDAKIPYAISIVRHGSSKEDSTTYKMYRIEKK